MHGLAQILRHERDADGSPERVVVFADVTHDENHVGIFHCVANRFRHDAGFDAGVLFDGFGASAEKFRVFAKTNGNLIAAASESQIQTRLRFLVKFGKVLLT